MHWLSWVGSINHGWECRVDDQTPIKDKSNRWTYIGIDMRNEALLLRFLRSLEGKPHNVQGMLWLGLFTGNGCRKDEKDPFNVPSMFCSEAIAMALVMIGYEDYIESQPGNTLPRELRDYCLKIPYAQETTQHPSLMLSNR